MDPDLSPILHALLENQGLQKISDAAALVLGNPFWIVDMNSNYMGRLSGETTNPTLLAESLQGYVEDDTMLFVHKNRIREKTNSAGASFSFQAIGKGRHIITCPVRVLGTIVAYISVIDEHRAFTDPDYTKMDVIAQIVSTELQKDSFYRNNKDMQYSYFLSDLLENRIRHGDIDKRLASIGYQAREHFYLLTVELEHIEARHLILHTIQEQIKFILVESIYCLYQNHSVFLFTAEKELTLKTPLLLRLERFLKESNLKAAVSDSFRDVVLVPRHYAKTLDSLRLGKQSMPAEALYQYSALATCHILDILKGIISYSDFCNRAVDKLLAYDQTHRKELTATLYHYLEQNCRIVPAAEAMAIHANTLRQRLEKIREITGCDLGNGHQTFDLMMALKLYYAQTELP